MRYSDLISLWSTIRMIPSLCINSSYTLNCEGRKRKKTSHYMYIVYTDIAAAGLGYE